MTTLAKSSLVRLQNLDKEYEYVLERLIEAATICGIEGLDDKDNKPTGSYYGHSKAEWVLKWLISHIGATGDDGQTFRASSITWKLLSKLLDIIPFTNAARSLNSGNILKSVSRALEENLIYLSSGKSKQRISKRDHAGDSRISEGVEYHIASFVSNLFQKSTASSDDLISISKEHLRAVTRINEDLAAQILSQWIRTIRINITRMNQSRIFTLSPFLQIWSSRSTSNSNDSEASVSHFAEFCLVPACLLYSTLSDLSFQHDQIVRELLELFAQHIFLPARSSYYTAKQQKATAESFWGNAISVALRPLQEAIAYCLKNENEDQLNALLLVVPEFYKLAIRNTRRTTLKLRTSEDQWLQVVFMTLSSAIGAKLVIDINDRLHENTPNFADQSIDTLRTLLLISTQHNIELNSDLLRYILTQLAGLRLSTTGGFGNSPAIVWTLVEAIIDLDCSIFVLPDEAMEKVGDGFELQRQLLEEIHFHELRIVDAEDEKWQKTTLLTVVEKLMIGFSKYQRAPEFVSIWYHEIVRSINNTGDSKTFTVWTSEKLIQHAEECWESTSIQSQFSRLLEKYSSDLHALATEVRNGSSIVMNGKIDHSLAVASASSILLQGMFSAMNNLEKLKESRLVVENLLSDLLILLIQGEPPISLRKWLWRLLLKVQQLVKEYLSPVELNMKCEEILDLIITNDLLKRDLVEHKSGASKSFTCQTEVLLFILNTSYTSRRFENLENAANELIQSVVKYLSELIKGVESTGADIEELILLMTKYPSLVEKFSTDEQLEIFDRTIILAGTADSDTPSEYMITLKHAFLSALSEGSLLNWTLTVCGCLANISSLVYARRIARNLDCIDINNFCKSNKAMIIKRFSDLYSQLTSKNLEWHSDPVIKACIQKLDPSSHNDAADTVSTVIVDGPTLLKTVVSCYDDENSPATKAYSLYAARSITSKIADSLLRDIVSLDAGSAAHMLMNSVILGTLEENTSLQNIDPKSILPRLAENLQISCNAQQIGFLLSQLLIILRKKTFLVSQHGIDLVLAAMNRLLTSQKLSSLANVAGNLYLHLCSITSTLCLIHRRSLAGRMHLLMPVLQGLMTNIHIIHPKSKPTLSLTPASWSYKGINHNLDSYHATAYSRALLTWTQPTTASATASLSIRGGLTDEVQKARAYSSEYAPYILMHWCSMQLVGKIPDSEVRKKLMPGIYACISAIDKNGLKAMSASMGRDERGIWGSLWNEWEKERGRKT